MSIEAAQCRLVNFDHVKFYVGNAKQAACWYCVHFGFEPFAYRGLETGSRHIVSHAVKQNQIIFVFESALLPGNVEHGQHLVQHGDGVKDVAFGVENLDEMVRIAKKRGATVVHDITEMSDDLGTVRYAVLQTYGQVTHTLIDRHRYKGRFMPGYQDSPLAHSLSPLLCSLPKPDLELMDHCVGNQPELQMTNVTEWYETVLQFHRFWSVDDSVIHTDYSALRSTVITNAQETVKMLIAEPVSGARRAVSQIQEFVDYYGGAGVQHIALHSRDILSAVDRLRRRGVQFLRIPPSYYTALRARLKQAKVTVAEDLDMLEKLHILVDYDDGGYLLQIFTKPVQDRPTLFLEIIQRHNHQGFGAGNIKSLFEAIEMEQEARGNLFRDESVEQGGVMQNGAS